MNNLKEHSFCNYEYLLAKMHATSVLHLLADLERTIAHALDAEIYLILRCVTQAMAILLVDPLQLANELIGRLRQIKGIHAVVTAPERGHRRAALYRDLD